MDFLEAKANAGANPITFSHDSCIQSSLFGSVRHRKLLLRLYQSPAWRDTMAKGNRIVYIENADWKGRFAKPDLAG